MNAIFNGRFVFAGTVLDQPTLATLPATFKKYLVPAESESDQPEQIATNFQLNTSYRVGREGRLLQRNLERQATEQASAAQFQDAVEEQLQDSLENPDQTTAAALEEVQYAHESAVAKQVAEAQAAARRREMDEEAAKQFIAEQDAMLIDEHPVSPTIEPAPPEWSPQQQSKPRRMRKRYVCRNHIWCATKRLKKFYVGEKVFVRNSAGEFEVIGKVNKNGRLPAAYLED